MSFLSDLNRNMINQYEERFFNEVREYFHKRYPNQQFLYVFESWNIEDKGIVFVKNAEDINLVNYESWLSIYLLQNHSYVLIDNNKQMLSACCKVIHTYEEDGEDILKINSCCIGQLSLQLNEIIEDLKGEDITLRNQTFDDETCRNAKYVIRS